MPPFVVALLGSPRIERLGQPVEPGTRKAVALLAYLAVTGQPHSRESLAALLWPEYEPERARAALRSALWALNKALGGQGLEIGREAIALAPDPDPGSWLDVRRFRNLLAECHSHGHPAESPCAACLPLLAEAASLYRDDFLAGFTLRDSPAFEEWRFFEAEGLRRELAGALERLAHGHSRQRELEKAIEYARRWLALDPLHEPAHRLLMLLYAAAGQRMAALRQYAECERVLRQELGVAPQDETTALFQAIQEDQLGPAAGEPEAGVPGNLSGHLPAAPFVGREAELAQIAAWLAEPGARLLVITGPGGMGKTRLALQAALQAARQAGSAFPHGVFFVPLAPIASVEFLVPAIADAIGFQFFGRADPKAQLLSYLRGRRLLLVLDNFEQLRSAAGLLPEMLQAAAHVKLLVTSRERLNLPGEQCLDLQGLEFPEPEAAQGAPPPGLADAAYSAVQLFIQSARRVRWNFRLSGQESPAVRRICRLVEGLPLGIELAAAWVRVISCPEIAAEIEREPALLATTLGGLPERQRSLRVIFEHSWDRLPAEARAVFRRLSVFRGGFEREAAERVAGATLSSLTALVDHSFIRRAASGRYEVHELLRQFGEERLRGEAHEHQQAASQHGAYYAGFLQQQNQRLIGAQQPEALEAMAAEIENVRVAWRWAVTHQDTESISRCLNSLFLFYRMRSRFQEGVAAFALAVEHLDRTRDSLLLGGVLARQGALSEVLGQFDQARERLEQSLALLRENPGASQRDMALAHYELGVVAHRQGYASDAQQHLLASLRLSQALEDPYGMANALNSLGNVCLDLAGQYPEARQYYAQALALRRAIGDQRGVAGSLNCLGCAANVLGQYQEGAELFRESIAAHQAIGDRYGMALALNNLGYNAQLREDYQDARQLYQESLAIRQEVGDQFAVALVLANLGIVATALGQHAEAERLLRESLALHREGGNQGFIAYTLNHLGFLACELNDYSAAKKHFSEALQIAAERQLFINILEALTGMAMLLAPQGQAERAAELVAFVLDHPAMDMDLKTRALRLLRQLEAEQPPEVMARARQRAKLRTIAQVVAEFQAELQLPITNG